nr:MAG TPA: hypothetical protein [Bacteriophage sp.]DAS09669.1 MAG TPA: hypothetical protein [Bacteriophage sp.]
MLEVKYLYFSFIDLSKIDYLYLVGNLHYFN